MGGGGRRHLDDIVEGKIFLGGLDANATTQDIESYCLGWCAFHKVLADSPAYRPTLAAPSLGKHSSTVV